MRAWGLGARSVPKQDTPGPTEQAGRIASEQIANVCDLRVESLPRRPSFRPPKLPPESQEEHHADNDQDRNTNPGTTHIIGDRSNIALARSPATDPPSPTDDAHDSQYHNSNDRDHTGEDALEVDHTDLIGGYHFSQCLNRVAPSKRGTGGTRGQRRQAAWPGKTGYSNSYGRVLGRKRGDLRCCSFLALLGRERYRHPGSLLPLELFCNRYVFVLDHRYSGQTHDGCHSPQFFPAPGGRHQLQKKVINRLGASHAWTAVLGSHRRKLDSAYVAIRGVINDHFAHRHREHFSGERSTVLHP
jgi:hypothetical protein